MSSPTPLVECILSGGRVWSAGGLPLGADAIAIGGGRIVTVGRARDLRRLATNRTTVIDLPGAMILPGFQDAHVHTIVGGLESRLCDLSAVEADVDAYRPVIAAYAAAHPERPWIIGSGWNMVAFERGGPTRGALDDLVPDRPVFLASRDGHSAWLNSRALEAAGIGPGTEEPTLGRIERESSGAPAGTLHELAQRLVDPVLPRPSASDLAEGLRTGQAYLHRLGITAWQDANVDPSMLATYVAASERGELTGRALAALGWDEERGTDQIEGLVALRQSVAGHDRLRASTVKVFMDGVIETRSGAMLAAYLDASGLPTDDSGACRLEAEALGDAVTALESLAFQVHVHAIGDRASRTALDGFAVARSRRGPGVELDLRHHIAHLESVDPADFARFAELGVTANVQALWASRDPDTDSLIRPLLGDARTDARYPFGSLVRAGARLAMGSDWSVTSADPLAIIEVAVRRIDPGRRDDPPFSPSESISLETALAAYTRGSAFVNHLGAETGELEVGRLADLVVLDRDILARDAAPPADARVLLTLVEGRVVYES
ncbi:MAG: amidohydrolase [Candidatus Limnocylindrales bacterium]